MRHEKLGHFPCKRSWIRRGSAQSGDMYHEKKKIGGDWGERGKPKMKEGWEDAVKWALPCAEPVLVNLFVLHNPSNDGSPSPMIYHPNVIATIICNHSYIPFANPLGLIRLVQLVLSCLGLSSHPTLFLL